MSKSYARLAVKWFQHRFEFRNQVKPEEFCCLDYHDLTRDPKATLEKLNEHCGWLMSDGYRTQLTAAPQRQQRFESKHEYTLEEYGLSKEWIQQELGVLFDHYALPRECPG